MSLLKEWEPMVPDSNKALFDAVVKDAAEFKTFRIRNRAPRCRGLARGSQRAGQQRCQPRQQKGLPGQHRCSDEAAEARRSQRSTAMRPRSKRAPHAARLDRARRHDRGASVGWPVGHRQIARPLKTVTEAIQKLASGDYNLPKANVGHDEIGDIWKATQVFAGAMQEAEMLRQAQADTEKQTVERRRHEMMALAQSFEGSVGGLVQHLSVAAQQMEATARSMATTAQQTNQQSNSVAAAAEADLQQRAGGCGCGGRACRVLERDRLAGVADLQRCGARGGRMRARPTRSWRRWPKARRRSARWSRSSTPSRARPICWRSMPPSRRRGRARPARALP